jgi:hypothetical protein
MSELKKHFERLMEFAKQFNFHQPFSQVYFAESKFVRRFFDSESIDEISRQEIFTFEAYENRFDEIMHQGHSWINLSFEGMLDGNLLVFIELPNYKNSVPFESVSVHLCLPTKKIIENNWDVSPFIKIT